MNLREKKLELCALLGIDPNETTHVRVEFDVEGPIQVEATRILCFEPDDVVDISTISSTEREFRKQ